MIPNRIRYSETLLLLRAPFLQAARPLFDGGNVAKRVVHACHHRMGTYWLSRILRDIAHAHGMRFLAENEPTGAVRPFIVYDHGRHDLLSSDDFRGTHMIRDPRDTVVSGYFYHLWTDEEWARVPEERWGNQSYQQLLNSVSQEEGLNIEIKNFRYTMEELTTWNYRDPRFLELRFEEVMQDQEAWFERIFTHYGFRKEAISRAMEIVEKRSLKRFQQTKEYGERPHGRGGKPGEWREILSENNKKLFNGLYQGDLEFLGYGPTVCSVAAT